MYAAPITLRLEKFIERKDDIFKLFDMQWNDKSIAMYMSGDTRTIKRFRAAYDTHGKTATRDNIMDMVVVK